MMMGVCVAVGGTGVNVEVVVVVSLPPCSGGKVPQAPTSNAMKITEKMIDDSFDVFMSGSITTSSYHDNRLKIIYSACS